MSNNVWEYIWPWRWQWPLLFVAGVVISASIFAILLILDSIRSNILKKKYKSQTSNITQKFYTFTFDNDLQRYYQCSRGKPSKHSPHIP